MNIKYCGPALDYSGYGEANRHDIAALVAAGCDVTVQLTRHCVEVADFGELGQLVKSKVDKPMDYQIKIIHTTPNLIGQYIEPGKYHIARVFWETDKLPDDFAVGAELCDEIWTGSQYNYDAIRKAGVTKPIFIIPEVITTKIPDYEPFMALNVDGKTFNFYSIFEWTERKNPEALLRAYWLEFENTPDVALTIKTYVDNFGATKRVEIDERIAAIKRDLGLKNYAPLYLYRELMDRGQIYRFHKTFDCFVSTHRGEGWGIPQMEAMLMGKPIISTNCGGIHQYLTQGKDALLIPISEMITVNNSRNTKWYCPDQHWADVSIGSVRANMRMLFDNRELAKAIGERGQETVKKTFSPENVGKLMLAKLSVIEVR